MEAVVKDNEWKTYAVTDKNRVVDTHRAKDVMNAIAEATHQCGDPGLQFDTTINKWHTCPNSGRINASNPCVTGDTKVLTEGGRWIRIDKLVGKESKVIVNTGLLTALPVNGSFKTGEKPVYRMTTKNGYEIKLTADHKVYTINRDFVPAAELTKDDFVLLPGSQVAEIKDSSNSSFYQMVGVYLGDEVQ